MADGLRADVVHSLRTTLHCRAFTMLETYQAYTDYDGMADLTRALYQQVADDLCGSRVLRLADGSGYDHAQTFVRTSRSTRPR